MSLLLKNIIEFKSMHRVKIPDRLKCGLWHDDDVLIITSNKYYDIKFKILSLYFKTSITLFM